MRTFAYILSAALLLLASSCAKRTETDTQAMQDKAFEAWMQKHGPADAVKQTNGMYVKVIEPGKPESVASADTVVWVRINYTARTLTDDVFVTRSKETAQRQGTYTEYTYYAPDYLFCGKERNSMVVGQYHALKRDIIIDNEGNTIRLREGSIVELYMPPSQAFGTSGFSDDQGYGGQFPLKESKPVIETLEVVEVVKDPIKREEKLVTERATEWGLSETNKDTITKFLYLDTEFRKELSADLEGKEKITEEDTVKIWFVGRFLDEEGFILDSNIDTVLTRLNRDVSKAKVLTYIPEEDKDNYISAFYHAIPAMYKGQWARIVFTSVYGYGATGLSAALKEQEDYYNYYMSYMMSSYYSNSYYNNSYYGSYYDNPYYGYNYNYFDYNTSSSTEKTITTEVHPYTPMVFEIYIEE